MLVKYGKSFIHKLTVIISKSLEDFETKITSNEHLVTKVCREGNRINSLCFIYLFICLFVYLFVYLLNS